MNTKYTYTLFLSTMFLLLLFLSFNSCSKEYNNTNDGLVKITSIEIRSGTNSKNIFDNFKLNGISANDFFKLNKKVDKESFLDLINHNLNVFESEISKRSVKRARRLSLEEIRDAMIKECENGYCCFIDDACVIAVKIAYHYKKITTGR